jgi:methylase of polypeptide subunit release factors
MYLFIFYPKALDIGCGSGILSFLLVKTFPYLHVTAIDKSKAAIECTKINS